MEGTRAYTWENYRALARLARETNGLEFNRQLLEAGEAGIMPMAATLGFRIAEVDRGRVVWVGELGEHLYNPLGIVHGGVAATLLDSAAGSAVHTTLPLGTSYITQDLTVHYLRPLAADMGTVRAIGEIINQGRRTALAYAEVRDTRDRLCAHATSSCMLLPPET